MLFLSLALALLLPVIQLGAVQAATGTSTSPTPTASTAPAGQYVRSENGRFMLGDKPFQYIGTSAYWLQLLDNDDDMKKTLTEIASLGVKVVRTWAFNDVTDIPSTGVWIRAFHNNGTIEINTGENGILRLDRIVRVAQEVGIHILFSLTNNWFPRVNNATASGLAPPPQRRDNSSPLAGSHLPRNFLSNDFGGMDTYVRHFHPNVAVDELVHDVFYSSQPIINSFNDYIATIVKRYKDHPSVLGWEAANDPRCTSTLPASEVCNPQTITKWTSEVTTVIKQNDPNHLVATGDSGYYCVDCTKVFPFTPPAPVPSMRRRSPHREGPLTRAKILAKDEDWKRRNLPQVEKRKPRIGRSIRGGKWSAPKDASGLRKRQGNGFGPVYDGSFGVDTEDLANIPTVDFSSFQFFPDQNTYGPSTSTFDQVVQSGIDWIEQHATTANTYGKPATLNGFGVVTNVTSNSYAPFNSSTVVQQSGVGTTQQQQVGAYTTWINTAVDSGVQGIIQYQWGQTNISSTSPAITHQSGVGQTSLSDTTFSPNDGYAAYDSVIKGTLAAGAARIAARTGNTKRTLLEL